MKFHAALARALADNSVDTMSGLIGDANLYMVDSFVRDCGGRYLGAANESGAALMALGYASVSGKVGVATVTHGPALTNTLTALCEGVKGAMPMVLVCGDTAVADRDHFQNLPQRELVVATGAGFEQLRTPATMADDVATAFRRAVVERRPIALNVPADFQWLDVDYRPVRFRVPDRRGVAPSSADLDDAIGIVAAAKRPIVLAGRGAAGPDAKQALLRLAARIDAPLATTLKAKDLFRGELFDLGVMGTVSTPVTVDTLLESDCLIAFGSSLNARTTSNGAFLEGKRIVQVNAEQSEVGKTIHPDAGVVGDPALAADLIVHWLDQIEATASGYRSQDLERRLRSYSPLDATADTGHDGTVDLTRALLRLDQLVPADRILVTDAGRFFNKTVKAIRVLDPTLFVYTINSGSIGLGMAEAIGAASAAPDRPTLLVTGDGGFMLGGLAEFNTAVRCATDLIVVICNDGSYGAEHVQFRNRQMDPSLTLFGWPDFAAVATALGGVGLTIRTRSDLDRAADAIRLRDRPLLIDLRLDPDLVTRD